MAFIDIEWFPEPKVVATQFYQLAGDVDVRSLKEPLKRSIQQVIAPAFRDNFAAGGRPKWTPLADATVRKKGDNTVLVRSGKLKKRAGQLNLWTIDGVAGEARAENLGNAEYGVFHQNGAERGNWSLPARPWAMLTAEEEQKVEEVFGAWLDERIAARLRTVAV